MEVSAVIPTRGNVDLKPILAELKRCPEIREILVETGRPGVWGRYEGIEKARCPIVYTQDDDCVTDVGAVLAAYRTGIVVNAMSRDHAKNYPGRFLRLNFPNVVPTLIGFGSVFDRELIRVLDGWERDGIFYREADRVFTALVPHRPVFPRIDILPTAFDPSRLCMRKDNAEAYVEILRRIDAMTARKRAIENLVDFARVAGEIGMKFVLMDGTLLGAVRDGDFCPGDEDDLDVGVMDADYHLTSELARRMEPIGFERYKPFAIRGKIEGFGLRRGGSHFDVMRINRHPTRPECYNFGRMRDGRNFAFVYPSRHFDDLESIVFHGVTCPIPADSPGFLAVKYGDWKTPIDRPGYVWFEDSNKDCMRFDHDML